MSGVGVDPAIEDAAGTIMLSNDLAPASKPKAAPSKPRKVPVGLPTSQVPKAATGPSLPQQRASTPKPKKPDWQSKLFEPPVPQAAAQTPEQEAADQKRKEYEGRVASGAHRPVAPKPGTDYAASKQALITPTPLQHLGQAARSVGRYIGRSQVGQAAKAAVAGTSALDRIVDPEQRAAWTPQTTVGEDAKSLGNFMFRRDGKPVQMSLGPNLPQRPTVRKPAPAAQPPKPSLDSTGQHAVDAKRPFRSTAARGEHDLDPELMAAGDAAAKALVPYNAHGATQAQRPLQAPEGALTTEELAAQAQAEADHRARNVGTTQNLRAPAAQTHSMPIVSWAARQLAPVAQDLKSQATDSYRSLRKSLGFRRDGSPRRYMMEQGTWDREFRERPFDPELHAIHADWLEEQGRPDEALFHRWVAKTGKTPRDITLSDAPLVGFWGPRAIGVHDAAPYRLPGRLWRHMRRTLTRPPPTGEEGERGITFAHPHAALKALKRAWLAMKADTKYANPAGTYPQTHREIAETRSDEGHSPTDRARQFKRRYAAGMIHAPEGGIVVRGVFYQGGYAIPQAELNKTTGLERQQLLARLRAARKAPKQPQTPTGVKPVQMSKRRYSHEAIEGMMRDHPFLRNAHGIASDFHEEQGSPEAAHHRWVYEAGPEPDPAHTVQRPMVMPALATMNLASLAPNARREIKLRARAEKPTVIRTPDAERAKAYFAQMAANNIRHVVMPDVPKATHPVQPPVGKWLHWVGPDGEPLMVGRVHSVDDGGQAWKLRAELHHTSSMPTPHSSSYAAGYRGQGSEAWDNNTGRYVGDAPSFYALGRDDAANGRPYGHSAPAVVSSPIQAAGESGPNRWRLQAAAHGMGATIASILSDQGHSAHLYHPGVQGRTDTTPRAGSNPIIEGILEATRQRWFDHLKIHHHAERRDLNKIAKQTVADYFPESMDPEEAQAQLRAKGFPFSDHLSTNHTGMQVHKAIKQLLTGPGREKALADMPHTIHAAALGGYKGVDALLESRDPSHPGGQHPYNALFRWMLQHGIAGPTTGGPAAMAAIARYLPRPTKRS